MNPTLLLLACALSAAMLVAACVLLLGGEGSSRKRIKRRLRALANRRSVAVASAPGLSLAKPVEAPRWHQRGLGRVQRLVGYDAGVPSRPLPDWLACVAALAIARGIAWLVVALLGPLGWVALPAGFLWVLRAYFRWCTRRWQAALFRQFPDALATVVRTVRVGVSLTEGMRRVADEAPEPTAAIFKEITAALAIGTALTEAMAAATARTGLPEYRFFATTLVLQSRTGGGLAATLDGLADVVRKRVTVRARGKALAGEARASAIVLALLPVVTVGGMMLLNPDYMAQIFTTPLGHTILAAACVTEGLGIVTMRTLIVRSLG